MLSDWRAVTANGHELPLLSPPEIEGPVSFGLGVPKAKLLVANPSGRVWNEHRDGLVTLRASVRVWHRDALVFKGTLYEVDDEVEFSAGATNFSPAVLKLASTPRVLTKRSTDVDRFTNDSDEAIIRHLLGEVVLQRERFLDTGGLARLVDSTLEDGVLVLERDPDTNLYPAAGECVGASIFLRGPGNEPQSVRLDVLYETAGTREEYEERFVTSDLVAGGGTGVVEADAAGGIARAGDNIATHDEPFDDPNAVWRVGCKVEGGELVRQDNFIAVDDFAAGLGAWTPADAWSSATHASSGMTVDEGAMERVFPEALTWGTVEFEIESIDDETWITFYQTTGVTTTPSFAVILSRVDATHVDVYMAHDFPNGPFGWGPDIYFVEQLTLPGRVKVHWSTNQDVNKVVNVNGLHRDLPVDPQRKGPIDRVRIGSLVDTNRLQQWRAFGPEWNTGGRTETGDPIRLIDLGNWPADGPWTRGLEPNLPYQSPMRFRSVVFNKPRLHIATTAADPNDPNQDAIDEEVRICATCANRDARDRLHHTGNPHAAAAILEAGNATDTTPVAIGSGGVVRIEYDTHTFEVARESGLWYLRASTTRHGGKSVQELVPAGSTLQRPRLEANRQTNDYDRGLQAWGMLAEQAMTGVGDAYVSATSWWQSGARILTFELYETFQRPGATTWYADSFRFTQPVPPTRARVTLDATIPAGSSVALELIYGGEARPLQEGAWVDLAEPQFTTERDYKWRLTAQDNDPLNPVVVRNLTLDLVCGYKTDLTFVESVKLNTFDVTPSLVTVRSESSVPGTSTMTLSVSLNGGASWRSVRLTGETFTPAPGDLPGGGAALDVRWRVEGTNASTSATWRLSSVRIIVEETGGFGSVLTDISTDGGETWTQVTPGEEYALPASNRGRRLAWRVRLETTDAGATPRVEQVNVEWTCLGYADVKPGTIVSKTQALSLDFIHIPVANALQSLVDATKARVRWRFDAPTETYYLDYNYPATAWALNTDVPTHVKKRATDARRDRIKVVG